MALIDLKKAELVALAEENGLDTTGTKAELAERLDAVLSWDDAEEEEVVEENVEEVAEEVVEEVVEEVAEEEASEEVLSWKGFDLTAGDSDAFLKGLYMKVLGREVDLGGLRHYTSVLDMHKTQTRADVLQDLLNSEEYKNK